MGKQLDWSIDLIWDRDAYPSKAYAEAIEKIYLKGEEANGGAPMIDTHQLNYVYYQSDPKAVEKAREPHRAHFIRKEINVYPDTTVWTQDFHFSYNEPLQRQYFWHEAYSEYPVVGVNWHHANAFCVWRTNYKNGYQASRENPPHSPFTCPRRPSGGTLLGAAS